MTEKNILYDRIKSDSQKFESMRWSRCWGSSWLCGLLWRLYDWDAAEGNDSR